MKNYFKKFFAIFLIGIAFFYFENSADAAQKSLSVSQLENLAGEGGAEIAKNLSEQIEAAVQDSKNFSAGIENSAELNLGGTITEIKFYKSQENKIKILNLIRKSMGRNESGEVDSKITEEEKKSAAAEVKSISENPEAVIITADIRVVDKKSGKTILTKKFVGDNFGKTAELASYNTCKALAKKILNELDNLEISDSKNIPPASTTEMLGIDDLEDVPDKKIPEQKVQPQKNLSQFKAKIGDTFQDIIYIKAKISDLKVGETLKICREAGDIVIGGEAVGKKELEIGSAEVTEINEKFFACKVISKTEEIKIGDIVKRA